MESKVIILCALLSGCSLAQTVCDSITTVKVPVVTQPVNHVQVTRPELVSDKINPQTDSYDVIVKALETDLEHLIGYSQELEKALEVYNKRDK